jgi:glycosyltransferase involved in cell wall biosynthesis
MAPMSEPTAAPPTPAGTATAARGTIAFIEGFQRPRDNQAHGTHHAAYLTCLAIAQSGRYSALHLYRDSHRRSSVESELVLPRTPPAAIFDRLLLRASAEKYAAVYVNNGEQILTAPHLLRPKQDWTPIICSIGTAQANGQWVQLLLSLASGAYRPTDGLIFKSRSAEKLFRNTWSDWSQRLGFVTPFPSETTVIANGVDVEVNKRSDALAADTRARMRLDPKDLVFLAFSRLSPATKGDFQALVVRWKQVLTRLPRAVLVLSGSVVDRGFVADLRQLIRSADVGDRVLVADNPFDLTTNARNRLMSMADVFLHLSTGMEETSSLVVHEAMAHSLPVITASFAGMPEIVNPGETGYLVESRGAILPSYLSETLFGQVDRAHLLAASKVVSLDWPAFLSAVEALGDDERRRRMGAAARRRAEANDLHVMARAYVRFFDSSAAAAEKAWTGPPGFRPLVDINEVIAAQVARPLRPDERVRLADTGLAKLLCSGQQPETPARLEQVIAAFKGRDHLTIAEVAAAARHPDASLGERTPDRDFATASRLITRLLNFGFLELH